MTEQSGTPRADAFSVTVDPGITVRDGEWDGARGEKEIFDWATGEDGAVDWAKAARGFIAADLNPAEGAEITRASFKLPIAYVENGELVGNGNAIRNALARLPQTEGLSDAVKAEAKAKLKGLLEKLRADHERADKLAVPDEATAKAWVVEHLFDDRKMPRPRMAALKAIEDRYPWLRPPRVDVVYRGLRNLTQQAADHRDGLLHPSDPVRDKSWTTSRKVADEYALAEHTIEDREAGRVGAVLQARASADLLLFNAAELAKVPGIGDVIHPDDGKPLRDMILAEQEVVALDSLEVVDVHMLDYDDADDPLSLDSLKQTLRRVASSPHPKRRARGWTDKALAAAFALLTAITPQVQADAAGRVYRTCTMDFALGSEDRIAVDRALAIADELGPKTDAAQVNAIAERLRADGFADKVTTDGRLIVTGYGARTGSQLYGDGKNTWYEFRSEDEVEKSLAGFDFATFTDDHPPVLVTADNWREYARGMLGTGATLEPPDEHGLRYVKVKICVGDIGTIRKMRDGKVQLSTGYTTVAVRKPGVDAQGVSYLYCQTDIQVNHESLVDAARAGPKARVLVDGATVFEASKDDTDMTTKPKKDQMDPEAAIALLDAIKAYAYAESPEAADGAMQTIAVALELDPAMVKQHLSGGEVMEMDGVKLLVSKDAATRIRASQSKVHGDAAKLTTDLAAAQGSISALTRTVDKLQAATIAADMRELEREIAPLCPQLATTWAAGKRPDSMTGMRVAAVLDLDPAAKPDLDAAWGPDKDKPAPTFDAFVDSLYSSTKRQAAGRSKAAPTTDKFNVPPAPKLDFTGIMGSRASA